MSETEATAGASTDTSGASGSSNSNISVPGKVRLHQSKVHDYFDPAPHQQEVCSWIYLQSLQNILLKSCRNQPETSFDG